MSWSSLNVCKNNIFLPIMFKQKMFFLEGLRGIRGTRGAEL